MMLVRWVTEPDDAMNYGFLAKCYLALTVISAAFFAAQVWGVTAVAGFWIVVRGTRGRQGAGSC